VQSLWVSPTCNPAIEACVFLNRFLRLTASQVASNLGRTMPHFHATAMKRGGALTQLGKGGCLPNNLDGQVECNFLGAITRMGNFLGALLEFSLQL
jgi:hypothetical protein